MSTAAEKTGPGNKLKHWTANCPLYLTASMCPGKGFAHVIERCPRQCPDEEMVRVQPIPAGSMHQANASPLSPSCAQHHLFSPPPDSPGHCIRVFSCIL